MKKRSRGLPKQLVASLEKTALRLPEPSPRNTGLTLPEIQLPRRIRIFCRTTVGYGAEAKNNLNLDKHVLIINLRGKGEVILDDVPWRFAPGEALLIRPDQMHRYGRSRRDELVWLFFSFDLHEDMLLSFAQHGPLPLISEEWEYVRQALDDNAKIRIAGNGLSRKDTPRGSIREGRIVVMFWLLLASLAQRQYNLITDHDEFNAITAGDREIIKKVQAYILEHLNGSIHIRDLASNLGISPTRLSQIFSLNVGGSLGRTIRRLRVNRAAMLLASSNMRIKEVADVCGFSSLSSFCRTFILMTGLTPKNYRVLHGHENLRPPSKVAGQKCR